MMRFCWGFFVAASAFSFFLGFGTSPVQADPYGDAVLADNPVVYYRLNEMGTAVTAVDQVSGQNGTYHNFATGELDTAGPIPPTFNGFDATNTSAVFDANNNRVETPDSASLSITGALSVEAWVNADALPSGGNAGIVSKYLGTGNNRSYDLFVEGNNGTGSIGFTISPDGTFASAQSLETTDPLSTNQWVHLVATFDPGNSMRIYVDGELESELLTGVPGVIDDSTAPLWIGTQFSLSNTNNFFDGMIDEVAIYDRVLTADEIQNHFNVARSVPEPGSIVLFLIMAAACSGVLLLKNRRLSQAV